MSDALAVMGRAGVENIGFQMKYSADARAEGEQLGYTWSQTDLDASKKLTEGINAMGVQMSPLVAAK